MPYLELVFRSRLAGWPNVFVWRWNGGRHDLQAVAKHSIWLHISMHGRTMLRSIWSVMAIRSACERRVRLAAFRRYLAHAALRAERRCSSRVAYVSCPCSVTPSYARNLHRTRLQFRRYAVVVVSEDKCRAFSDILTRNGFRRKFRPQIPYGASTRGGQVEPLRLVQFSK